jgi:Fe-S-cluster containining protein
VEKDYEELLEQAKIDLPDNKRMLKHLKKKNLDELFQKHHEKVFKKIDCLICANCCTTTGPILLVRDIDRISKSLRMKPAVFEANYLRRDEEGDWVFKTMPCPFLGSDNYCLIYDVRPKACREYPHTDSKNMHKLFDITLTNSTICPAVAMILERIRAENGDKWTKKQIMQNQDR